MNTDANQFLILRLRFNFYIGMLIKCCKKNDSLTADSLIVLGLARSPFVYVMWAELGHSHFLYVPAVSNVLTNGNGTGTKNVLKRSVSLGLSLVSCLLSMALLL